MKGYVYLSISILFELIATPMLKMSDGLTSFLPLVVAIISYGISFFFLGLTLKILPLSLAYAIWAGVGTVLTTLISVVIWGEVLSSLKIIGILLIVSGVIILNFANKDETVTVKPSN
jgi:multidrug resistance protein EbrB